MLKINVVEPGGRVVSTTGSVVVIADAQTHLPVVLIRRVAGLIEYLSINDGERFQQALAESVYPSQMPYPLPNKVVRQ